MFSPQQCFLFSPPNPVKKFYYECGKKFYLDDLIKLYDSHDNNAIVLVSGKRTDFYLHNPNRTILLKTMAISLPNQHKTGGYSAQRFERIRNEKIDIYATKICELMVSYYVENGQFNCKKLIIAGPAEMKDFICKEDIFTKYFANKLAGTFTIAEISDTSIYQVVTLASNILSGNTDENDSISNIESMITDPSKIDLIIFGETDSLSQFYSNQLREIYVSHKSEHFESITKTSTKTKIITIRNPLFSKKYGPMVGIRYFPAHINELCDDECKD